MRTRDTLHYINRRTIPGNRFAHTGLEEMYHFPLGNSTRPGVVVRME